MSTKNRKPLNQEEGSFDGVRVATLEGPDLMSDQEAPSFEEPFEVELKGPELILKAIDDTRKNQEVNAIHPKTAQLLPRYEARLFPGSQLSEGLVRAEFPAADEAGNEKIARMLTDIQAGIELNGATPAMRGSLESLKDRLKAQANRARGIRTVLEANPGFDQLKKTTIIDLFKARAVALGKVRFQAMTDVLRQTTPQRSEIMSFAALFDESGCDGTADISWSNISPNPDAVTKARKEFSFLELPESEMVDGYRPLTQTAVDKMGAPYPVTLLPLVEKLVYQTRCSAVVLGGELAGLRHLESWAKIAYDAGAVVFGNVSLESLGRKAYTKETPAKLRDAYSSTNPASKSIVVCGNHPIAHDQSEYGIDPVVVNPSFIFAGKLYGNAKLRSDLSFTNPPTNPLRDRLIGTWFKGGLICPSLRDRRKEINQLPLALLTEVSNDRLDGINVVFSSSKTAWGKSPHPVELELGTNLARVVVTHRMMMCSGLDMTNEEAEAEGRTLNSIFQTLSGPGKPFLKASCDATLSRVQPQVQRKDDGTPILDGKGQPVLTGKEEMVHSISVIYRKGAENFLVVLTV